MKAPQLLREKFIVNFKDPNLGLKTLLTRSDQDLGGFSTVKFDVHGDPPYGTFSGNLSLDLPEDRPEVVRLGYAMFRTRDKQPTWFGFGETEFHDWSTFNQLSLRVRGDHRRYFVNIQSDTPHVTDLYQHRLFLKTPGEWELVTIPFSSFILTNGGLIQKQYRLDTEHIKSVGISIIDGQYGPYKLDVDWIKVMQGSVDPDESTEQLASKVGKPLLA